MSELKPIVIVDIQKLKAVSRRDVIEKMKLGGAKGRITWVDSLTIAAGAREEAGMSTPRIAKEIGGGEQTIRAHLTKKAQAEKLVRETHETLVKGGEVLTFLEYDLRDEKLKQERQGKIPLQEEIKRLKEELQISKQFPLN